MLHKKNSTDALKSDTIQSDMKEQAISIEPRASLTDKEI